MKEDKKEQSQGSEQVNLSSRHIKGDNYFAEINIKHGEQQNVDRKGYVIYDDLEGLGYLYFSLSVRNQ
jgi:hypothetical protein